MPKPRQWQWLLTTALLIGAALLSGWWEQSTPAVEKRADGLASPATEFDYFLIALSWSPTWCEDNPRDQEQCGKRGFGFVLHGLWPQHERGSGPQHCGSGNGPDPITRQRALAFMPSRKLIEHEWRAHGSCSGLDADDYFALADRAYASVRIPSMLVPGAQPEAMTAHDVRSAFVEANPGMHADMIGVTCAGRDLAEVRICVGKDLAPRKCGRGVRMSCPRERPLRIPLSR